MFVLVLGTTPKKKARSFISFKEFQEAAESTVEKWDSILQISLQHFLFICSLPHLCLINRS